MAYGTANGLATVLGVSATVFSGVGVVSASATVAATSTAQSAVISQNIVEVWGTGSATMCSAFISQIKTEAWISTTSIPTQAWVTQVFGEVWAPPVYTHVATSLGKATVSFNTAAIGNSIASCNANANVAAFGYVSRTCAPASSSSDCFTIPSNSYGVMRLYADGRLVATSELSKSGEQWRLPSGYKGQFWQIEFEARVKIYSVQMATSAKELADV